MEQLVGILRSPAGLTAIVSERREAFSPPRPAAPEQPLAALDPYLERALPLDELPPALARSLPAAHLSAAPPSAAPPSAAPPLAAYLSAARPSAARPSAARPSAAPPSAARPSAAPPSAAHLSAARPSAPRLSAARLSAAWRDLAPAPTSAGCSGEVAPRRALDALLLVLEQSVADPASLCAAPPPPPPPPRRPRRTAAHPRGYAGTKARPPKAPRPRPLDLRTLACSRAGLSQLLERRATASPLRERLRRRAELPPALQRDLLWPLRGCEEAFDELAGLWWALDLAHAAPLRRCLSRLLALGGRAGLSWGRALAAELPRRRVHLAELILESGAAACSPSPAQLALLGELSRRSREGVFRHRIYVALEQLRRHGELSFLLGGFELANRYQEQATFDLAAEPPCAVQPPLTELLAHLHAREAIWERYPVMLWTRCLALPGFAQLLAAPAWRSLDPQAARQLCTGFGDVALEDCPELRERKWAVVREEAPALLLLVERLPASHQRRAVDCLSSAIWRWDDEVELRAALGLAREVLPQLCQPPYALETDLAQPLATLLGSGLPLAALRAGARACCRALDDACARRDDAQLVRFGLESLCELRPDLVETTLRVAPTPLLRCAKLLGLLPPAQRAAALRLGEHQLLSDAALAPLDAVGLAERIEGLRLACAQPLIRRRLRAHLEGRRRLSPAQLARERARILARLPELRLSLIRRRALDLVGQPYELDDDLPDPLRHALLMQPSAGENRRALRRVIRAHLAGRADYLERHPANRGWLREHPKLDRRAWREGLTRRESLAGEEVVLSLERDPLEVLRLGTHVGSCLGLGGCMAHSAVAIMLDVNKAVVFARAGEQVLGRQVLAISKDERLVPHAVYPTWAEPPLRALFKAYDEAFARRLGLPLAAPDPEPEIELILAQRWWDDGAWDLEVRDDPEDEDED